MYGSSRRWLRSWLFEKGRLVGGQARVRYSSGREGGEKRTASSFSSSSSSSSFRLLRESREARTTPPSPSFTWRSSSSSSVVGGYSFQTPLDKSSSMPFPSKPVFFFLPISSSSSSTTSSTSSSFSSSVHTIHTVDASVLFWTALTAAIPMICFGFMDQIIMIRAGEFIDSTIGVTFRLATLTAAAVGQLCSDTSGVLFGNIMDNVAQSWGIRPPAVAREVLDSTAFRLTKLTGAALGVALGCLLGMSQLLFIDPFAGERKKRQRELDTIFEMVMSHGPKLFHCERATLFVYDKSRDEIWSKFVFGLDKAIVQRSKAQCITTWVMDNKRMLNCPDAYQDPRFNPMYDEKYTYKTRSVLAAPVIDQQGDVIGVIMLMNKLAQDEGVFNMEDERMLEMMCHHVQIFMERFAYGAEEDTRMISLEEDVKMLSHRDMYLQRARERIQQERRPSYDMISVGNRLKCQQEDEDSQGAEGRGAPSPEGPSLSIFRPLAMFQMTSEKLKAPTTMSAPSGTPTEESLLLSGIMTEEAAAGTEEEATSRTAAAKQTPSVSFASPRILPLPTKSMTMNRYAPPIVKSSSISSDNSPDNAARRGISGGLNPMEWMSSVDVSNSSTPSVSPYIWRMEDDSSVLPAEALAAAARTSGVTDNATGTFDGWRAGRLFDMRGERLRRRSLGSEGSEDACSPGLRSPAEFDSGSVRGVDSRAPGQRSGMFTPGTNRVGSRYSTQAGESRQHQRVSSEGEEGDSETVRFSDRVDGNPPTIDTSLRMSDLLKKHFNEPSISVSEAYGEDEDHRAAAVAIPLVGSPIPSVHSTTPPPGSPVSPGMYPNSSLSSTPTSLEVLSPPEHRSMSARSSLHRAVRGTRRAMTDDDTDLYGHHGSDNSSSSDDESHRTYRRTGTFRGLAAGSFDTGSQSAVEGPDIATPTRKRVKGRRVRNMATLTEMEAQEGDRRGGDEENRPSSQVSQEVYPYFNEEYPYHYDYHHDLTGKIVEVTR